MDWDLANMPDPQSLSVGERAIVTALLAINSELHKANAGLARIVDAQEVARELNEFTREKVRQAQAGAMIVPGVLAQR